jgi:L-glutamine-phosphate cytidylyltransferase
MAAGKGSRISSITKSEPKSFLKLGDKTLIDHQIEALLNCGIRKIVIVIGYCSQLFKSKYSNNPNIELVINPFYENSNVLASVWFAKQYLFDGFYFMHADTFFEETILKEIIKNEHNIVLAVKKKLSVEEEMKVQVNKNKITMINKTMDCNLAYGEFIGLAKITEQAAQSLIPVVEHKIEYEKAINDYFESVLQEMININVEVDYIDIGNRMAIEIDFPEDYQEAKMLYKKMEKE